MEVGCPGTWRLGLPTPNPGSKSTPKACPTHNQATSPARHTQPQPRHPSHRTRSSVEIITVKNNDNNNNNNNKNNNNNNNNNSSEVYSCRPSWEQPISYVRWCVSELRGVFEAQLTVPSRKLE